MQLSICSGITTLDVAPTYGNSKEVIVGVDTSQQLADLIQTSRGILPKLPDSLVNGVEDGLLINLTNWGKL